MRTILISTLTLICAVPLLAQSPNSDGQMQESSMAADVSNQVMPAQQAMPSKNPMPPAMNVAPNTPVVTLEGVCDSSEKSGNKPCKTVLTHADISQLIDSLTPGASPTARRRFAIRYAQLLAASAEARRKHLEADPAVAAELRAQMELARVQVLSKALYRQMEENSANVPLSDIQKYYLDHKSNFDQGEVRVISVPGSYSAMEELLARAAKGEDFDQLQQEIFKNLGIQSALPSTRLGLVRRTALPPFESKVFDLKVGEACQVEVPDGGFKILKLESSHPVPIEIVQPDIVTLLQNERMQRELGTAAGDISAQFNLEYLGLAQSPVLFTAPEPARQQVPKGIGPALMPSHGAFRQSRPSGFPSAGVGQTPQR